jgi:NADH-quinone oxidoreductase subunit N
MITNFQDFYNLTPLLVIAAGILISLIIEMYTKKAAAIMPWLSIAMFLAAGLHALWNVNTTGTLFQGMLATGGNVNIFHFIFTFGAAIVCLLSIDYIKKEGAYYGEYYILIQSSVLGMMLMAAAKDLLVIFMGLEIMSVCFYALAGINRKRVKSNEAALKYFLLGAFATGFIVYGMALIYGAVHSTSIDMMISEFPLLSKNILFVSGILLFLVGFSFKIAAFPFHMWVPDVYQGSPTTIAGLFSTSGKAAAFSAIIVTVSAIFISGEQASVFRPYLAVISLFSMLFGSIVAIAQDDIKRMLAYSSISHAGYMLIGLAAGNHEGVAGIIFYLTAYTFMNLGAFGIIALVEGREEANLSIKSYSGLANKYPFLSALLAICMFSLAGLPPFAGFFGKYYVFIAAVKADLTWLAILGVISSAISVYFYLRIVVLMYFKESTDNIYVEKSSTGLLGVVISVLMIIALGILPGSLINLISAFLKI